jgi:hypothetical protein
MIVQLVPSINAYKHKLIEEKREFAEDNKYKIIGLTPKEFAIISNNMAREALNLSERLVFVFFIAFIVTLIEIIILNYQMKKAGYNQSGSGNLAPLNTRP